MYSETAIAQKSTTCIRQRFKGSESSEKALWWKEGRLRVPCDGRLLAWGSWTWAN